MPLTAYPIGRGSFASASFHGPSGEARTKILSYQTFASPSHGRPFGKFEPPAKSNAPFDVPAMPPAKPTGSGNIGSSTNVGAVAGAAAQLADGVVASSVIAAAKPRAVGPTALESVG